MADLGDSLTEVTSTSFFSRIMESLKGILFGIVVFVISFPVLVWNEGRAVHTARGLQEGASVVVSIPAEPLDVKNEGRLVHMVGQATTKEVLADSVFNLSLNALRLQRGVEMYQWVEKSESKEEKKLGGGTETKTTYTYSKEWASNRSDSDRFKMKDGHVNPPMAFGSGSQTAQQATLGAHKLSVSQVNEIGGFAPVPLDAAKLGELTGRLAPALRQRARLQANTLVFGNDSAPEVGDLKVTFQVVQPKQVSIIALQQQGNLVPYTTKQNTTIEVVRTGAVSAEQMFQQEQQSNSILTWVLRAVGAFLMWLGIYLVLRPIAVLASVVPFLGDLIAVGAGAMAAAVALSLSVITIAIAWLAYRPLLGIALLIVAGGVIYLLYWRGHKTRIAKGAPATA